VTLEERMSALAWGERAAAILHKAAAALAVSPEQPPDAVVAGTCECDLGECTCGATSPERPEGDGRLVIDTVLSDKECQEWDGRLQDPETWIELKRTADRMLERLGSSDREDPNG